MALSFVTRPSSAQEINRLRLFISTFGDGSGNQRGLDNTTRADWRQLERCVAEFVGAVGGENKEIFDVLAPDDSDCNLLYGLSVKSKQLPVRQFNSLGGNGRVYMEIANSPAKFFDALTNQLGVSEEQFRMQRFPKEVGDTVLRTVELWHQEGKSWIEEHYPAKQLLLNKSCYLSISLSKPARQLPTRYQIHTFDLKYPNNLIWRYKSDKCLTGFESQFPDEPLVDWYALSGGQLKYYPRASAARFASPVFTLETPAMLSIKQKAQTYFPGLFT